MITEVQDYLKANDLNSAQGVMDRLDKLSDQLSADLRKQIDTLREKMADMASNETAG
jgi:hypothetical protein